VKNRGRFVFIAGKERRGHGTFGEELCSGVGTHLTRSPTLSQLDHNIRPTDWLAFRAIAPRKAAVGEKKEASGHCRDIPAVLEPARMESCGSVGFPYFVRRKAPNRRTYEWMRPMTTHFPIDHEVQKLRAQATRYRNLASTLFDRRSAAQAVSCAQELEERAFELET
jgi:hypothetical protein